MDVIVILMNQAGVNLGCGSKLGRIPLQKRLARNVTSLNVHAKQARSSRASHEIH